MLFSLKKKDGSPLNFKTHFALNDPIKLEYRGRYHSSRVEDMHEDSLLIAWPTIYGSLMRLKDGDPVTIISSPRSGMQGYVAQIRARIEGPPAMLELVPTESLGRVQRRNFVRVPESFKVCFRVVEPRIRRSSKVIETFSKNLSAGGMLISIQRDDRPIEGDELEVMFDLPGGAPIRVKAKVVRILEPENSQSQTYDMGIEFTTISKQDQDLIVKRVFARQTELHKAGLM